MYMYIRDDHNCGSVPTDNHGDCTAITQLQPAGNLGTVDALARAPHSEAA